jgi:hypothetical protein
MRLLRCVLLFAMFWAVSQEHPVRANQSCGVATECLDFCFHLCNNALRLPVEEAWCCGFPPGGECLCICSGDGECVNCEFGCDGPAFPE